MNPLDEAKLRCAVFRIADNERSDLIYKMLGIMCETPWRSIKDWAEERGTLPRTSVQLIDTYMRKE